MRTLFLVLTAFILILSACKHVEVKQYKTNKLLLRQLVKKDKIEKSERGSFFLIAGRYNNTTTEETIVKVFALVDGRYRYIEFGIEDIRIQIDNSIITPFLIIESKSIEKYSDEEAINYCCNNKVYVIHCPEKYLPEKLLPIEL